MQVEIQHDGQSTKLEVEEGTTILDAALDSGLELSHDCKMGVCMTCPAKLVPPPCPFSPAICTSSTMVAHSAP